MKMEMEMLLITIERELEKERKKAFYKEEYQLILCLISSFHSFLLPDPDF